jgi:hypothetical protein
VGLSAGAVATAGSSLDEAGTEVSGSCASHGDAERGQTAGDGSQGQHDGIVEGGRSQLKANEGNLGGWAGY